jgi:hypothetical protein
MAVRLSALRAGRPLPPGRFLVLISVRGWVDTRDIVRLEGLSQLKKIHLIGTRTRDLPACCIVPQPTTLPRAPLFYVFRLFLTSHCYGRICSLQPRVTLAFHWLGMIPNNFVRQTSLSTSIIRCNSFGHGILQHIVEHYEPIMSALYELWVKN